MVKENMVINDPCLLMAVSLAEMKEQKSRVLGEDVAGEVWRIKGSKPPRPSRSYVGRRAPIASGTGERARLGLRRLSRWHRARRDPRRTQSATRRLSV